MFDLVELIRTTMPNDNPGQLPKQDYVDIVAYILNLNGYPQGPTDLVADDMILQKVKIDTVPPRR